MTNQNKKKGREVLQHQATQETATHVDEQHSADYDRPSHQDTITDALRNKWAGIVSVMDENRDAFAAYVDAIRKRIERSHGWTGGTDYLRSFINDGGFVTPTGDDFRVTHGYDTVWCREVCRRWPDVAPHILPTLKASKFDVFYPDLFKGDEGVLA